MYCIIYGTIYGNIYGTVHDTVNGITIQSGRGTRMMGPKMGPIFFRDLAIKSDPRRFLTSYWHGWIGNFGPDLFRGVPGSF